MTPPFFRRCPLPHVPNSSRDPLASASETPTHTPLLPRLVVSAFEFQRFEIGSMTAPETRDLQRALTAV